VRIVVVGDVRLYRDGLALILATRPRFDVLGTAATVADALELISTQQPDVVLLDTGTPQALSLVRHVHEALPRTQVVALTVPEVEETVIDCAEAGVAGYVTRDGSLADLVDAIESATRGETTCSPRIAAMLLRRVAAAPRQRSVAHVAELTAREREIARLIENGLSNKDIARQLFIEVSTVKNHVHHILEKLRVTRRSDVVARVRGGV
jgi:two-component system, NarL family, nitrate/nitrite response regulator NarL